MTHRFPIIAAFITGIFLLGCQQQENHAESQVPKPAPEKAQTAPQKAEDVVAVVNGFPITKDLLRLYASVQKSARPQAKLDEKTLLENLINLVILAQDAEKKGLEKRPEVQSQLAFQRINILASADLREILQKQAFSEEELKKEYERLVSQIKGEEKEYKARHILVESKEEAEAIIKALEEGKDFAELAKEHSIDPSAQKGGELGWFTAKQVVKPFAEAVAKLKPGEYTKEPVKTRFGWHIIQLEEVRTLAPPTFEESKKSIEAYLESKKVNEYLQKLREQAHIEIKSLPTLSPQTPKNKEEHS
ncbi:MAG: peptidylprolyl isomerase [Gammaproteobacteria bacterium]|nr:MAG: peptidylprolyl isomerase [Gammaproteobacteria bacterium]